MLLRFIIFFLLISYSLIAHAQDEKQLTLSLKEAILLAVRENPNVQKAQLDHIQQKFALEVAKWQFKPHYSLTMAAGWEKTYFGDDRVITRGAGVQPEVSWLTPMGTQVSVVNSNNWRDGFRPGLSLQIVQPLMKGFGQAIVEAALCDAVDSERISRLNVENTLRTTVTAVINAYLVVVSAENTLKIDEEALKRAQVSVQQTQLFIQAGRKARVELTTVEAEVANSQTKLENDKNSLDQARYALLTAIGIDPNTKVKFNTIDVSDLINKFSTPTLEDAKRLTLENDIQYQVDQITLQGATKRSLAIAEDNARWQLNLTGSAAIGGGQKPNDIVNVSSVSQGVELSLKIPIDDKAAKQAILNAKIALRNAQMALQQEKWAKETDAINNWNTIYNVKKAVHFAEDAERLQKKTYQFSFQKYTYGLIDSVALQNAQQQLVARQQALLEAQINYLKALVNLDQQIGRTLRTWNIQVRYC